MLSHCPGTVPWTTAQVSPTAAALDFIEPDHYQSAIHGGDNLYSLLGRGKFRAELTKIRLGHLTLQRGREYLPRLAASSMSSNKVAIVVWFGENQLPVVRGVQMQRGEMLCLGFECFIAPSDIWTKRFCRIVLGCRRTGARGGRGEWS